MVIAFIKVVLLIALILIAFGAFFVFTIINRFRRKAEELRRQMGGGYSPNAGRARRGSYSDDETVVDSESRSRARKKIFSKDEGEYVDFKEEK